MQPRSTEPSPAGEPTTPSSAGTIAAVTMGRRLTARLVDVVAVATWVFALSIAHIFIHLQLWSDTVAPQPWGDWFLVTITTVVVYAAYDIVFTAKAGGTPGKDLMGIKVVDATTGGRPRLGQAALRWLPFGLVQPVPPLWVAALLTGAVGITSFAQSERRGLADRLAGTKVVAKALPTTEEGQVARRRSFAPRLVNPAWVYQMARTRPEMLSKRGSDEDEHLL